MRGRSTEQLASYEDDLAELASLLASSAMTVREIRERLSLAGRPVAAATVYARVAALAERGYEVRRRKRRKKIAGKPGWYERVFSVVTNGVRD